MRRPLVGVVTRKIPEDLKVTTIFGDKEIHKVRCVTCGLNKLKSEFYLESKSRRKYKDQVRKQCIVCWDKRSGYMGPERNTSISNTVMNYICDEVN